MNEPRPVTSDSSQAARPVFISYATADRKEALSVCTALERRGTQCWISTRDVAPGENYQEAIVRSLRNARAMVLVFSDAANNSDEIKKELSLASRYHIPVMALRIEDVEPSDAFAYELSTRQWIDAFESWDRSIDALMQQLQQTSGPTDAVAQTSRPAARRARVSAFPARTFIVAAAVVLVVAASLIAWLLMRPGTSVAAHTMQVRLAGFQLLSPDLPSGMPQALADEINAAFNDDGVVTVSTASAAPPGNSPAYAMSGTIRREGDKIKVIVRLTNERSGITLWSGEYAYDATLAARVPRLAAVQSSMVVRCGLFGASTYPKSLPDNALIPYLGFCESGDGPDASKSLNFAQKTVAIAPDFSWGWSGVAISAAAAWLNGKTTDDTLHKQALEASDRAIQLDPTNSEAYAYKAVVLDKNDMVGQEALLKKALDARPLACGCEHHLYALFLLETGRVNDSIDQFRRGIAVLPLNEWTQLGLGGVLLNTGDLEGAKKAFDAAADLDSDPSVRQQVAAVEAVQKGDFAGAARILADPKIRAPQQYKDAVVTALQALASASPDAKASAARALAAQPLIDPDFQLNILALLGAPSMVIQKIEEDPTRFSRSALWQPGMAKTIRDPNFAAAAERLGLMHYWKTTHTRPDVCSDKDAPPFCQMI
ncbi:MAG TPA: TIR domain-containing protein [Sphingomicrobium sp.]|nr:TIR domain-containing protein [Sphingomicrobium sp.]